MSWSPVFYRSYDNYVQLKTGNHMMGKGATRFLGVYSARLPIEVIDKASKSDIGVVWKAPVIEEILSRAKL